MTNYDELIVGCGASGATLANLLRQYGYKVAIFDRDKEIYVAPRAMQIDADSCRIFQQLGIIDRLMGDDARPANEHVFVDKNRKIVMRLEMSSMKPTIGYAAPGLRFHQPALERLLREDFAKTDCGPCVDTYLGYEVSDVDGEGDKATLTAKNIDTGESHYFSARFLVGADGGASQCRKYVTPHRIDMNYSRRWIVMDVVVHDQELWDSLIDRSEFMCRPDAAVVFVKGCNNHVRFDFEVTEEVAQSFNEDDARALISNYFDTSSIEFQRIAPYHFYAGMPDKWRRGKVLLAGDAAHLTSPFSGQGLNMGLQDAANLAFKFDMVLRGLGSESFIDSYQGERWAHCESNINGATARGLMVSANSFFSKLKRSFSFFMGRSFPGLAVSMNVKMSNIGRYRGGLVSDHELAGRPLIQPHVIGLNGSKKTLETLLDDIAGDGFLLLTRDAHGYAAPEAAWFEKQLGGKILILGRDIDDVTGDIGGFFDTNKIDAVMVRPDRYIFDAGQNAAALTDNLKTALGAYSQ